MSCPQRFALFYATDPFFPWPKCLTKQLIADKDFDIANRTAIVQECRLTISVDSFAAELM